MTQDIIINYLTEHKEQFKKDFGITKIGLFGSYARNEAKNDSDIDILIELKKDLTDIYEKKSLLKEIMEKAFNKKVDIYLIEEKLNKKLDNAFVEYFFKSNPYPLYVISESVQTRVNTIQIRATMTSLDKVTCPYISNITIRGI